MKENDQKEVSARRKFLQTIATGTAVLGASIIAPFQKLNAAPVKLSTNGNAADE